MKTKLLFIALISFLFIGCVSYSAPVRAGTKLSANSAYLCGYFSMQDQLGDLGVSLKIVEIDSNAVFNVRLQKDQRHAYSLISVKPGKYRIEKILFTYAFGEAGGEKPFASNITALNNEFEIQEGELLYIGDYIGFAISSGGGYRLGIQSISENYENTSEALKKKFGQEITIRNLMSDSE